MYIETFYNLQLKVGLGNGTFKFFIFLQQSQGAGAIPYKCIAQNWHEKKI